MIGAGILVELCGVSLASYNEAFATYVVDFLLINNSHAVLSLAALFFIPEALAVVKQNKKTFSISTAALLLFLLVLTLGFKLDARLRLFVEMFLSYFGVWHAIKQTYGLVRSYSIQYLNEIKSKTEVRFEKGLIYLILFLSVTFNPRTLLRYENLFGQRLEAERLQNFGLVLMGLACLVLMYLNLRKVKSSSEAGLKLLYIFPYVVFPYSSLTILGFVLLKGVHGIQSYFLYRNIYKKSVATHTQKSNFLVMSFFLMTFQAGAYVFSLMESHNALNILVSYMTISVSYIHYYHERFLFKIKNQPQAV